MGKYCVNIEETKWLRNAFDGINVWRLLQDTQLKNGLNPSYMDMCKL